MKDVSPIDLKKIDAWSVRRSISHITIHHSATVDGRTFSWPAIKKYHMDKGWKDIGYNLGVELVKDTVEVLYGRSLAGDGAHCPQKGMNRKSVGICVVGNYDIIEPSTEHWRQTLRAVRAVQKHFYIPVANVQGHNEYAPKTCPGKMFNMDKFRKDLKLLPLTTEAVKNVLKGTLDIAGAGVFEVEMKLTKKIA